MLLYTIRKFLNQERLYTKSVQKKRGLFELRGSSWFQGNLLAAARFVQIS